MQMAFDKIRIIGFVSSLKKGDSATVEEILGFLKGTSQTDWQASEQVLTNRLKELNVLNDDLLA